jgi:hypothetical protein
VITSMNKQAKTKICVLQDSNNSYFMARESEHTCSILNFADAEVGVYSESRQHHL